MTEALPQLDWSAIRGMRNILVHECFGVDRSVISDLIATKLRALDGALAQYTAPDDDRQSRIDSIEYGFVIDPGHPERGSGRRSSPEEITGLREGRFALTALKRFDGA